MRGGKRVGAGAPKIHPENSKRRQISMTDEEHQKVLMFLKKLRTLNIRSDNVENIKIN